MDSMETLDRLSRNPHYRLSERQVAQLEEWRSKNYRKKPVLHKTGIQKHDTSIKNVHSPELEVENGNNSKTTS